MIVKQLEVIMWDDARKLCQFEPLANVESLLRNVGFTVTRCNDEHENTICDKEEYFESLRCRKYTLVELFSDEEIEKGIEELDRDYFKYKDSAEFTVTTQFVIATKT